MGSFPWGCHLGNAGGARLHGARSPDNHGLTDSCPSESGAIGSGLTCEVEGSDVPFPARHDNPTSVCPSLSWRGDADPSRKAARGERVSTTMAGYSGMPICMLIR